MLLFPFLLPLGKLWILGSWINPSMFTWFFLCHSISTRETRYYDRWGREHTMKYIQWMKAWRSYQLAVLSAELLRLWWMKSATGLLLLIADIWSETIVRTFINLCLFSSFNSRDTHFGPATRMSAYCPWELELPRTILVTNQAQGTINKCLQEKGRWTNPRCSMLAEARDERHFFQKHTSTVNSKSIVGGAKCTWCMPLRVCAQPMVSYREVATEDAQKSLCRLLEAEAKPLSTDLLCIKWGGLM